MNAVDLCIFLSSYTLVVSFTALAELFGSRRAASWTTAIVALAAVSVTTAVGFYVRPGIDYFGLLWFLVGERDFSAVVSAGLGVAAALVWVTRLIDRRPVTGEQVSRSAIKQPIVQFVLAMSIFGVVVCSQAFIWKDIRGIERDPAVRVHAPGFIIEKVADLDFLPVRVAASEQGKVYVCYDYFEVWGTIGGAIVELTRDPGSGKFFKKIVADSPLLMRTYGLVARNGDLFVSRSGIRSHASQGQITFDRAGAVTQLRDVNGDGYFEFAHDIVTDLPGIQGPETMHQNNGITFSADGSIFILSASASDRSLDVHPWSGTVLRVSPDFTQTEVFARGFRNPFGLVMGPDDELFVTENDIDESPGDELNHVVQGGHYGHPFVVPNERLVETEGFVDPILVGEHESNFLGMAYATSPSLPEEYRNCIYMADFMQDSILRLKLERSGDTYKVKSVDTFATITTPVDIAVTPSGEFFVISRRTQNVYRIRPRNATIEKADE